MKPANMGSSVGVSKAVDEAIARDACALALGFDEWILAEEAIVGREIELAVLGDDPPEVSVPGEVVPGDEFYSYADKYESDAAELLAPAPLTDEQARDAQDLAVRAFEACRCEAMARVDLFFEEPGRGLPRERGQHDPRLHADLDVPAALGGLRRPVPGAHRPSHRPRARPPRPPHPPRGPAALTRSRVRGERSERSAARQRASGRESGIPRAASDESTG